MIWYISWDCVERLTIELRKLVSSEEDPTGEVEDKDGLVQKVEKEVRGRNPWWSGTRLEDEVGTCRNLNVYINGKIYR